MNSAHTDRNVQKLPSPAYIWLSPLPQFLLGRCEVTSSAANETEATIIPIERGD